MRFFIDTANVEEIRKANDMGVISGVTTIGCGLCCGMCDAVFRMNADGKSEAYQEATGENQADVQSATDACPVAAISWQE